MFGTIDLRRRDGERLNTLLDQPKRLALVAYLAAHQRSGPVRREEIVSILWPESSPTGARSALSTTLSRLRKDLGEEVIYGQGEESIGLSGDEFTSDVAAFEDALAEGQFGRAVESYGGSFLKGLHPVDSRPFEGWVDRRRTRYRERAYRAALDAAEAIAGDDDRAAEAFLRRAEDIEPLRVDAVERLVSLLADRGDTASVVRVFGRFRDRLQEQLELAPPDSLTELVRQAGGASDV